MSIATRRLAAALAVGFILGLTPSVASAGPLVASATGCDDPAMENPFLPWIDPANYVLAPDGTLEGGAAGWSLDGASIASGNEPFYVHGAGESQSLAIAPGGSATTPAMCVGIEHPTLRFFARRSGGSLLSSLRVQVLFEDAGGDVHSLPIGTHIALGTSWAPTLQMVIGANLLALLPNERTAVAFRFTASSGATWHIDDVYVDPYRRS